MFHLKIFPKKLEKGKKKIDKFVTNKKKSAYFFMIVSLL